MKRWKHLPTPIGPEPTAGAEKDDATHQWTSAVWASAIDPRRHIFCNRSLNMKSIEAVGFDMDYTLAQYRPDTFESLAYRETVKKLVYSLKYPDELLLWNFDWRYMVRGLVLDKKRGNILKMDRHKYVKVAYHGFQALSREERRATYTDTPLRESFDEPDFALIDTLFSLAEAYMFAQLVEFKDAFPDRIPSTSYAAMYRDVRAAVDLCHRDGTLKNAVANDPARYITRDDELVDMLQMLRDSGRKTFLVTNSLWDYTHVVMNYLVGNCGTRHGKPRDYSWLSLFDLVITGSAKPGFFLNTHRAQIYEVDIRSGMLFNTDNGSPMAQVGGMGDAIAVAQRAEQTQPCRVFQGGSVAHLHGMLDIAAGAQVLYVGDHIFGDILRSKKSLGWRTMLVVPELVREIHVLKATLDLRQAFHDLRHQIDSLDDAMQRLSWAIRFEKMDEEKRQQVEQEMLSLQAQREAAGVQRRETMQRWHQQFHPVWGQLMKTGYQNSRFAHQVERFACLYTSHVTNLGYYSPDKSYRTCEDFMPHELDILDI
ncbi:unnamed protein product [Closterium sp. NIES-64]|nr:unnamed protein product [Closterium sp. NIES-65]CAI5985650.1 unnamed protein product [Closterium sp. NIES-64]